MDSKDHEDDEAQLHEAVLCERNETNWEGADDAARDGDEAAQRGIVVAIPGKRGRGAGNQSVQQMRTICA
jgi:hypothetical protein